MVRKLLYLLFFWIILVPTLSAQTIQWMVKPNYDYISHLNSTIFKCKTKGRVQLVDTKGKELLSFLADSVTNYSENLALVLDKSSNNQFRIKGIVNGSGAYTQVEEEYFANRYSYFSEGFVSVTNKSGKAGYINSKGKLAIPCQYRIARPFIKGWASVEPYKWQKQTLYIDREHNTLKIPDFHNGKVIMGSSFNSAGEALVAYYDDDNAIINTKGEIVRKYVRKKGIVPVRPYDFAFDENGKNNNPDTAPKISFDAEPSPFSSNQLMGYKKTDRVVVPPQFSLAGRFVNGCAIICQNDKFGIVRLIDGTFSGRFEGEDLFVASGKKAPTYTYTLTIPESLNLNALRVMFDTGDGNLQSINLHDNKYEFTPVFDNNANVCVMKMQVMSDGLLLWSDSLEKSIMNVNLDISVPVALSERANEQDILQVQSVITNNSNLSVTVSGSFSASFAKGSKNKIGQKKTFKGKIAPKSKMEVFADLNVVEEESTKVSVSVKVNQKTIGTKSAIIQLKPFY